MGPKIIAPSLLSADFVRLADECQTVLDAGADWLHVDVMDGHYVPNITIGLPVVEALRREFPDAVLDVHLMIEEPDRWVARFVEAGATVVSFHPEATHHPHRTVQAIRQAGGRPAIALNPASSLDWVDSLGDDLEMVLLMSVNPGFGGQRFIPGTLRRLRELRRRLMDLGIPDLDVEVDGGVGPANIGDIAAAGANVFVAGSSIFGAEDRAAAVAELRQALGTG